MAFAAAAAACATGENTGAPIGDDAAGEAGGDSGASDTSMGSGESSGVGGDSGTGGDDTGGGHDGGGGGDTGGALDSSAGDGGSAGGDGASDAVSDAVADAAPDASCSTSVVVDYCASIPPLPAAPVIDGVLDCGPALVAMAPQDWSGPAPLPPFPAGNSAAIAVAWRSNGLYVFVKVTTPVAIAANAGSPPFQGAGVEVFVDSDGAYRSPPTYDNPGTIQLVVAAPPDMSTPGRVGEGYRNAADQGRWASTQFATFSTAGGFVFEGFVVGADLGVPTWTLSSSNRIGFDIAVDVSYTTAATTGPDGHRVGQYFFHVGASPILAPYADPRSLCTPTLTSQ